MTGQYAIKMSHLKNKSEILAEAAKLLHDNCYYPAVAHSAYYSCYQLLKHIWLYSLKKTELDYAKELREQKIKIGSHDFLINKIAEHIKEAGQKDCQEHFRIINKNILKLKQLRHEADYEDSLFDSSKSSFSLSLSNTIASILKKY